MNKRLLLFINYRAFGHSIVDNLNVHNHYREECLIIDVGEGYERNRSMRWIIDSNHLFFAQLPSWHRRFKPYKSRSLRKYVGPQIQRLLCLVQKTGYLSAKVEIHGNNAELTLRLAAANLSKRTNWDSNTVGIYLRERSSSHRKFGIERASSVGTQVYCSLVKRIEDEEFTCPVALKENFLEFLKRRVDKNKTDDFRLFVLIVSDRGKTHHGNGIARYLGFLLQLLNESQKNLVMVLGANPSEIEDIRTDTRFSSRVLIPSDFSMDTKAAEFLSILNAEYTFGDPSGIWCIFLALGKYGVIVDSVPAGELLNRCVHIPRRWTDESGNFATPEIVLKELLFAREEIYTSSGSWTPILRSESEITELLDNLILRKAKCEGAFQVVDVPDRLFRHTVLEEESKVHFK